jgi:hypothetical protein
MNRDVKRRWLEALRSDKYEQTDQILGYYNDYSNKRFFCCLGVLCDIYSKETGRGEWLSHSFKIDSVNYLNFLPNEVMDWAGLIENDPRPNSESATLSAINDSGSDFNDIADIIEKNF